MLTVLLFLCSTKSAFCQIGERITIDSIQSAQPTGMNYSPWLNDDLNSLVANVWPGNNPENFHYVDIKLKFSHSQLVSKVLLYDYEGSFKDMPAYVYALNGTVKTFLGVFTGEAFKQFIPLLPNEPILADAIIINKFGNNIPQKIQIFGVQEPPTFPASETDNRISIASILPEITSAMNFSPWLNDDMTSLVNDDNSSGNLRYSSVTLSLSNPGLISKISLYDYLGEFPDKPAYLYALKGSVKTLIGVFTGESNMKFTNIVLAKPTYADAILINKYGNNIPQKVLIYSPQVTAPIVERFKIANIVPTEYTGVDYSPWLNDDLNSLIQNVWDGEHPENSKYVDVVLKFEKPGKITKVSMYDYQGTFEDKPAYIYALNNNVKTLLGKFTGEAFSQFVDIILSEPIDASALVINRFGNGIPQKIQVYGYPSAAQSVFEAADTRLKITEIKPAEETGMVYTSWLNDNLLTLVPNVWPGPHPENFKYIDVVLKLEKKAVVSKVSLYDYQGTFADKPAYVYALNGSLKSFIGIFTGESFQQFINYSPAEGILADAILIHKFGNNIPQKVQIYGKAQTVLIDTPIISVPAPSLVKIPIEAQRWYQVNNVANGLDGLFDGVLNQNVTTGYGKVLPNFDAYYPINKGEEINIYEVKFYDGEGNISVHPFSLYAIDDKWNKTLIATFTGTQYLSWVGPNPDKVGAPADKFKLTLPVKNIKYLVINTFFGYPNEMELYGTYKPSPSSSNSPYTVKPVKLKDGFGVNAFEWDFESNVDGSIDTARLKAVKSFSGIRHYMDWGKLEAAEGSYTFNPTRSGGWKYDLMYETCKKEGIEVLACLKTTPNWMLETYPADQRDAENVPVKFGKDFSDPLSYVEQAKVAFQYAARYGSNTSISNSLLSVNATPRWNDDPLNVVKVGLNLIKYIECDNERDKWWRGRKAYQTGREYAANLSAFYDGHKNTMGEGVGVKNADPSMKVVMGGLAATNTDYVRAMVDWCKQYRGYNADSTVNLCWDVINYHLYSNDAKSSQSGNSTRGSAPEVSGATQVAKEFLQVAHQYVNNIPVWLTETGYDLNQGSPLKAIPIGEKTAEQVQADWILRTALLNTRIGISKTFMYQLYDDNFDNPGQFASSGLINQNKTRKAAADYVLQVRKQFGEYTFKENIQTDPVVDRYEWNNKSMYVLYIPDEKNRTAQYTLSLGSSDSAFVYKPVQGADSLTREKVNLANGNYTGIITETPVFITAIPVFNPTTNSLMSQSTITLDESGKGYKINNAVNFSGHDKTALVNSQQQPVSSTMVVYPNPTTETVSLNITSNQLGKVDIRITEVGSGKLIKYFSFKKDVINFTVKELDIKFLVAGSYVIQAAMDNAVLYHKLIKLD